MRAHRLRLGRPLSPFGDLPADLPVLGESLAACQERVLGECGISLVDAPPDEPWLALGDHTWLTAAALRRFLDAVPPQGGQMAISGPFLDFSAPLQDLPEGRLPVAVVPGGEADLQRLLELPRVEVDLGVEMHEVPFDHVALDAVSEPVPASEALVHTIEHWSHLHRVNLLALVSQATTEKAAFDRAPWYQRLWVVLGLLLRARSLSPWRIAEVIAPRGPGCKVHPTATVEASILGANVEVGPHAVVRASWLGDGVKVHEHARVNLSVVGERATLARDVMCNLCLLMPGALLSQGFGYQACVLGRESFVAMGATAFDLSFGGEIKVMHRGERVSSGSRFLGVAIGHRARLMPHVIVGYGEEVPNDALLVADPGRIARRIPADLPAGEPYAVVDGELVLVRGRGGESQAG